VVDVSEIQKELNSRTYRCIKKETGIDLSDPKVISNLSLEDNATIQEVGFKCALKVIRNLARTKFSDWIVNEYKDVASQMEKLGERLTRFGSKVGDSAILFKEIFLQARVLENLVTDIDGEELLSDHKAVVRLLLMSYASELRSRIFINSLSPLLFSIGLAQSTLSKDMNWCTSMLALTIEEQLIKKKAKEFGIVISKDEYYHSDIRQSREMLLADSHRKIRNKVVHKNWNPTEDEMDDIIAHVLKITQFFSTEVS
jgi:hypothetical protein